MCGGTLVWKRRPPFSISSKTWRTGIVAPATLFIARAAFHQYTREKKVYVSRSAINSSVPGQVVDRLPQGDLTFQSPPPLM